VVVQHAAGERERAVLTIHRRRSNVTMPLFSAPDTTTILKVEPGSDDVG
jgi:hypothetical protein